MIGGVQAYSSAYAPYAVSSARRAREPQPPFAVPPSALRAEAAQKSAVAAPAGDPAADAAAFSRDYPQLLLNQAYAPPPVQQIQQVAGSVQGVSAATDQTAAEGGRATPGLGQEIDAQARGQSGIPGAPAGEAPGAGQPGETEGSEEADSGNGEEKAANGEDLSKEEQAQVTELKSRDREVRAHEQAHQAVGGAYAGGASYEFQQGPDGQRYAVGGEVSIDMSAERDPQATIAKMQQVKAAAMAPAQPSGQDRSVAASATATEMQARAEMSSASAGEASGETGGQEGGAGEAESASGSGEPGEPGASGGSNANGILPGAGGASGSESASGESAGAASNQSLSSNPFLNPYAGPGSGPGVLNLPEAYRAIDIVA